MAPSSYNTVNCISDSPGRRQAGDFGGWGLRAVGSRAPSQSAHREGRLVSSYPPGSSCQTVLMDGFQPLIREPVRRDLTTQWEPICRASPNLKYSPCHSVASWVTLDGR